MVAARVPHGEEELGGVVDELLAGAAEATVEPRRHQLAGPADEDGRGQAPDRAPPRGRPWRSAPACSTRATSE